MFDDSFRKRFKNVPLAISCAKNWGTKPHNHSEFEILYLESGKQTVKIGDKAFSTSGGDLMFINPMEIHSFSVDVSVENASKCICFDCSMLNSSNLSEKLKLEVASVVRHIPSSSPHNEYLRDLFLKIYNEVDRDNEGGDLDNEISAMEIKSYITLIFAYLFKNSLVDKDRLKPKNADFCASVIDYVKVHYNEPITSKEISAALSFNQSYFCRNFKKNFGNNFTDYLNTYRISVSRKLLEEGKSVTNVAFEVGFQSATRFSKYFKKNFGVLPSKYKLR
ncbi:MAG: AraC family transcriptional regulator [Clostridia bacterium]|nr:AraC family transcriptional regulator [Clostridia bacterium]